jgi:hypothetical protein
MIPVILAHGLAGDADEFAVILLGIALIAYIAAVWIGDRLNKEPRSSTPADDQTNVE